MKNYILVGVGVLTAITIGIAIFLLAHQHALNQKMEEATRASSRQVAASARKKEADLKRKESVLKRKESEQAESAQSNQVNVEPANAVATSVVEPEVSATTDAQPASLSATSKERRQSGGSGTAVAVIGGPNETPREVDDQTRAYVEAGVLNPQGGMKYSPEIESKAQSNLKRYQEEK
ncbi:hypothetical protein WVI01_06600 [Weissella viridescens]|uniref:Uncharacterized protein n=1 Tax=Weissella viridescens TaxID=1629 RepID=A0A0R2HCK6_WEIVI|nr:hypothetical protein [Weissella viridescens]KRN47181.1 hypothetical protein IV50_GL000453 [Weissella viridescens]GEA94737.1 hypothetical protein WVI01_06600 [Weissella viridescens]